MIEEFVQKYYDGYATGMIKKHAKELLDAMVVDGILKATTHGGDNAYWVPKPPHKHEWYPTLLALTSTPDRLRQCYQCKTCSERVYDTVTLPQ